MNDSFYCGHINIKKIRFISVHNHSFLLHIDHTPSPLKRKHTPLVEEEEDEGVSLVPPEEKKIKPDLKREDARYPNHTFISLR